MTHLAAVEQDAAKDIDMDRHPPNPELETLWEAVAWGGRARIISFTCSPPNQLRKCR